ncbi:MAG: nucleotide pyrophosphatase [Clostridia bacterium]|nr:nucleotide pyrophosphatase [Clostridia bacterium]
MNQNKVMPDYNNSILNLITSILKKYKVETQHTSLPKIDKILKKQYKNIVLMILDGMGENILKNISPNGILSKNKIDTITSVYPCTTTAAMTTYYSGKAPIETGWIAWTQFFKEYGKYINVLQERDFCTEEKLVIKSLPISDIIGYKTIYEQIEEQNKDTKTYEIMPSYCAKKAKITMVANTIQELCGSIITLCKNTEDKFVMAYQDNPDSIIHKNGCYSEETRQFIAQAEKEVEKMLQELKDTNTLLIISADHGHQDINETIDILELDEIQECLIMPPTLEGRMVGFFVKDTKRKDFEDRFNKIFKDKYILYTKEEIVKSNLFGYGKKHKKIEDFLGDYIAIAIADTRINLETYLSREMKEPKEKKSSHCGLTKNEMEVPLIVFDV